MATDTTILQQQTIADRPSNWSQTVTFAPFDPKLGTLTDVQIGITAEVTGTVSLENLGPTSGTEYVSLPGTVSVFGPDDTQIASVTATANGSASLGAFDGADNYLGNSRTTLPGLSGTQSFLDIYQGTTSEMALFSGSNPVPLTVDASVLFEEMGVGNLQTLSHASAGAVISLQYDYTPPVQLGTSGAGAVIESISTPISAATLSLSSTITINTIPQTITVAEAPTGWSKELSAAQFNPALGTLDSVNITLTGNETAGLAAENLGATAATLGFSETPTLALVTPDPNTYVRATPNVTAGMSLDGYDGSQDFAGTSGQTDQGLTATAQTTAELTSALDLAAFTGDGSITLPLYAFSASSLAGPADLLTQLADQAGATVTISYTYTPADTDLLLELALAQCFVAGTRIATAHGEVAVERLQVGDAVRTELGAPPGAPLGAPIAPIIWIGRREIDCARHPHPRRVWPVRVAAGAFGPGRPGKDLFLSPDHAIYLNEVLIPIKHLINGTSIAQIPTDHVTYYHLELPHHDVLLAEGLPAESFFDLRDGAHYADRPGPTRLYPDYSARMWEAFGCARLIVTGPELTAAQALIALHAARQEAA